MAEQILRMWTIFDHPVDYPTDFVVVETVIVGPPATQERRSVQTAPTLDAARRLIPPHLYRQHRSPEDDPVIVETWF